MTSVDSGVDTGNDSNDSSIAQHDVFAANQNAMSSSSTVVTASNNQIEEQAAKQNEFRITFAPVWPIDLNPISSLRPVLESYHCTENNHQSRGNDHSAGPIVSCSSNMWEFRIPPRYDPNGQHPMDILSRRSKFLIIKRRNVGSRNQRKMKTLRGLWKALWEVNSPLEEQRMRVAAATNNTMMMIRMLNKGISPNNHDEQGRTPLHLAACRGYTDMVRILLERGADPNRRDCIGNTPLHLAAITSKISVVTLLLQAGTNILSSDQRGYNPLQLAQAKLRMLQNCKGEDMMRIKEEVHNVVGMLLAYLEKQKDACEQVEALSSFCSRLSLANTSDQIQDDVKDLLANIDSLKIAS